LLSLRNAIINLDGELLEGRLLASRRESVRVLPVIFNVLSFLFLMVDNLECRMSVSEARNPIIIEELLRKKYTIVRYGILKLNFYCVPVCTRTRVPVENRYIYLKNAQCAHDAYFQCIRHT
jgi:hypothetical protein